MEEFLNKLSNIKNDIDVNIEKINDIKSSFKTKFNINSMVLFKQYPTYIIRTSTQYATPTFYKALSGNECWSGIGLINDGSGYYEYKVDENGEKVITDDLINLTSHSIVQNCYYTNGRNLSN